MSASDTIPAVFLDRDGTLIEDRGHLGCPSEVVFFPETVQALRLLQQRFRLFIVTNQPGIAEGTIDAVQVANVHGFILDHLARFGIAIERVYCCPHRRADGCPCIKPKPHYLLRASRELGVDLGASFVIGDHPHDVELARNAGATGIYVLTGHGIRHRADLPAGSLVADGILQAATMILDMSSRTSRPDVDDDVKKAAAVIRSGGVVVFPTETVYGLGANAFDARAVARVFEVKGRPRFDPLIVHVSHMEQAESLILGLPEPARTLAERFWPGPLTLVVPRSDRVPEIVTAGLATVAVRMPDHPLASALIREAGVPVAAPSANLFGRISPTTAQHVRGQLGDRVDLVLDGGPCRVGVESTIVSLANGRPVLLRAGGVPVEEIEDAVGRVLRIEQAQARPMAPGQLPAHYAPRTPLVLRADADPLVAPPQAGLLSFRPTTNANGFAAVEVLSANGDMREAAANLFAALHRLDALGLDLIVADPVPDTGLGPAINDRLRRAAAAAESPRALGP